MLSTASLHTHKSHELQKKKKKSCRFSKWRRSAWATGSWNSTAVRRGVSRTEGEKSSSLYARRQQRIDVEGYMESNEEMEEIRGKKMG